MIQATNFSCFESVSILPLL